jgi:hypothetical protein
MSRKRWNKKMTNAAQKGRVPQPGSFRSYLQDNEAAGMPDGAAWALAEEMAGLDCGDGVDYLESEDYR